MSTLPAQGTGDIHGKSEGEEQEERTPVTGAGQNTGGCDQPAEGRSPRSGRLVRAVREDPLATKKRELAGKICTALKVHTTIEEEIFYPAFLEATEDKEMHHEAEVEHDGAKKLIAEIEASGPEDDYYDAKVKVLSEMIKHHVKEEEQRDGMFAEARQSDMDLKALGEQLATRKAELMSGGMRQQANGRSRMRLTRATTRV